MASTRRIIHKALVEVIEGKTATDGERLKACRLLLKIILAPKGKPRGRAFAKKKIAKNPHRRLERLLSVDPKVN